MVVIPPSQVSFEDLSFYGETVSVFVDVGSRGDTDPTDSGLSSKAHDFEWKLCRGK
jgi:hypothetical protein